MTADRTGRRTRIFSGSPAFLFVLTMGAVNLFADATYEGGASINGPFLATLGAGAAAVSVVAGLGEFLGYALRLPFGRIADRTGRHWPLTFVGYAVNLLAVPAMALAPSWPAAAAFMLAERIGRAIRKPTVESMLSYTTNELGKGWVYALNTALDETGALLGPIGVALVVARSQGYRTAYGLLIVPAALAIASLTVARIVFPLPSRLETGRTASARAFDRSYWLAMAAASLFAAGLMSFELISYHLSATEAASRAWVPVLLAIATAGGIVASLVMGRLFDRVGGPVVYGAVLLSAGFSPLVFFGSPAGVIAGMVLWGVGYATQDTLFKAIIAGRIPEGRRNTAFGLFYAGYGVGWLAGSVVTGLLYERSRPALVAFSVVIMLASLPVFAVALRRRRAR